MNPAPYTVLDAVASAIERARCPGREGPYGGYDYGHNTDFYGPEPEGGRYVVRDFREPRSPTWGAWVHQTASQDEHEQAYLRLTGRHIAQAAIDAFLAQGIEAGTAETGTGSVHESPVADKRCAQPSAASLSSRLALAARHFRDVHSDRMAELLEEASAALDAVNSGSNRREDQSAKGDDLISRLRAPFGDEPDFLGNEAAEALIRYREALTRIADMTDIEADFDGFEARDIARVALGRDDSAGCDCSASLAGNDGPHHPSCALTPTKIKKAEVK